VKPCASLAAIVIGLCFPLALARAEMTWRNGDRLPDPMTPAAIHARVANWTAQSAQDGPRDRHVLVRFAEPVLPKQRQTLASKGVELLQPLGQNAFFARIDAGKLAPADLERDQRISSLHEIHPNWKIHSSFHVDNPPSWAVVSRKTDGQTPDRMAAYVILHSDVDRGSVRSDWAQRYGLIVRSELCWLKGGRSHWQSHEAAIDDFMAIRPRTTLGGLAYHAMNRVSGRQARKQPAPGRPPEENTREDDRGFRTRMPFPECHFRRGRFIRPPSRVCSCRVHQANVPPFSPRCRHNFAWLSPLSAHAAN